MLFEWDNDKAELNDRKHTITFDEAQTIFTDNLSIIKPDSEHSSGEERLWIIGMSNKKRLLIVCFTERGEIIRLISARKASKRERNQYEEDNI